MILSGHDFAHAITAPLSWHVQNCDLIRSLALKFLMDLLSFNSQTETFQTAKKKIYLNNSSHMDSKKLANFRAKYEMFQGNFISYYLYGILESWTTYSRTTPFINPKISESALNCTNMKYSATLTIHHKCKGQIYGNISIIPSQWIYSWGRRMSYCNIL